MVRRLDADILVMSNRYLEEIRLLPYTVLSNVHAQYKVRPSSAFSFTGH